MSAPTPGPLSAFRVDLGLVATTIETMHRRIEDLTGSRQSQYDGAVALARDLYLSAPTAPVEASGSEREAEHTTYPGREHIDVHAYALFPMDDLRSRNSRSSFRLGYRQCEEDAALRPQPSGDTREGIIKAIRHHVGGAMLLLPKQAEKAADAILALLSARPLALGGQHSGGEPSEAMIQAGLKVDFDNEDERATIINVWQAMRAVEDTTPTRAEALDEGAALSDLVDTLLRRADAVEGLIRPDLDPETIGRYEGKEAAYRHAAELVRTHPSPTPAAQGADRVREIDELISACEAEFCSPETEGGSWTYGEGDDSEVAYPKSNITFGHIRRAREALAALKSEGK